MKIVIAGAGEVGSHLAKMLSNESNDITVIDSDQERLESLKANSDVVTIEGNPSSIHVLNEAGVAHADLFIAVSPSEQRGYQHRQRHAGQEAGKQEGHCANQQ